MKIGIVGGTGNISTSIVNLALAQGHEVVCVNRGQHRPVPDGARLAQIDRRDQARFEELMQAEKFDAADALFLGAYYREDFPVVILKPSTTYGPQQGLVRQVAWDFSWLDRIRQGKPILVCGDGNALHQHLHVDDAAQAFVGVLDKPELTGQAYNVVRRGYITWADYHRTAMAVLGREVELVGVPFANLKAYGIPGFDICEEIFAHHVYYSPEKLFRDVPEFRPAGSLADGMAQVIAAMDGDGRIPAAGSNQWEEEIIAAQKEVRP